MAVPLLIAGGSIVISGICLRIVCATLTRMTAANHRKCARTVSMLLVPGILVGLAWTVCAMIAAFNGVKQNEVAIKVLSGVIGGCGALLLLSLLPAWQLAGMMRRYEDDSQMYLRIDMVNTSGWVGRWALLELATGFVLIAFITIPTGIMTLFAAVGLVPLLVANHRNGRELNLLWLLALVVRNRRDLITEIRQHAEGWSGFYASRLFSLAATLESGNSLCESLRVTGGLLPQSVLSSLSAAEATGDLASALDSAALQHSQNTRRRFMNVSIHHIASYLVAYASVIFFITSFISYWIVPKLKYIFNGFGTDLPPVTESLLDLNGHFIVWGVPAFMALVVISAGLVFADFRGWANLRLRWFPLSLARFSSPLVLRQLSRAVERGDPLPPHLEQLAGHCHRPRVADRLYRVSSAVSSGTSVWQALHRQGFLSRNEMALLQSSEQSGNTEWVLRELGSLMRLRWYYRLDVLCQFLRPAGTLVAGSLVVWICVGIFLPLTELIGGWQ